VPTALTTLLSKAPEFASLTPQSRIKYVAFRNIYTFIDLENSYYQQRWNSGDEQNAIRVRDVFARGDSLASVDRGRRASVTEQSTPTSPASPSAALPSSFPAAPPNMPPRAITASSLPPEAERLISFFGLETLLDERVNILSSGELRKTLIVLSLLSSPRILILDNPYIGLDARSRGVLDELLGRLAHLEEVQIVAIVSRMEDIPPVTTHILPVKDKEMLPPLTRREALHDGALAEKLFGHPNHHAALSDRPATQLPPQPAADGGAKAETEADGYENVLLFRDVEIKYGNRVILSHLYWQVRRGERWLLWGGNGSGKSTLLGILFGDNPQAYSNDISLFDRRRGAGGESIWEIKRRIGFISPEITLYYRKNIPCLEVVGSGFHDTIGSPYPLDERQRDEARRWMEIFGIGHLATRPFLRTSSGEQQLVLLARLFVKDPQVLVLDEPLNSLDSRNKELVNRIICDFCTRRGKTLIYVTHYEQEIPPIIDHKLEL